MRLSNALSNIRAIPDPITILYCVVIAKSEPNKEIRPSSILFVVPDIVVALIKKGDAKAVAVNSFPFILTLGEPSL